MKEGRKRRPGNYNLSCSKLVKVILQPSPFLLLFALSKPRETGVIMRSFLLMKKLRHQDVCVVHAQAEEKEKEKGRHTPGLALVELLVQEAPYP